MALDHPRKPDVPIAGPARPSILLAEDDDAVRWALTALFEQSGYRVEALSNGAALLASLFSEDASEPDVLVLDVRMPGVSGLTILEGLRADGWTVPVVVVTAFADTETTRRVEQLPATICLPKPLDPDRLEAAVRRAIREGAPG